MSLTDYTNRYKSDGTTTGVLEDMPISKTKEKFLNKALLHFIGLFGITNTVFISIADEAVAYEGQCWMHSTGEIEVVLKNDKLTSMIHTLAHEMVHARQFAEGRLKCLGVHHKTTLYSFNEKRYMADLMAYRSRPWEIEAFNLQDELYEEFISSLTATEIREIEKDVP